MATFTKLVAGRDIFIPSSGFQNPVKTSIFAAQFGDGYSQRTPNGINNISREWSLNWVNRPYAHCEDILDFFEARKGSEAFLWTPPKNIVSGVVTDGTQYSVYCPEWSIQHNNVIAATISAKFIQVYETVA